MSAKLFIGQIPKHMNEDQLTPLFQPYGSIIELAVIRDKATGTHRGCAFLTYTTKEQADSCIAGMHNKHTLPTMSNPIQVKYASSGGGPGGGPGSGANAVGFVGGGGGGGGGASYKSAENKLFIGMIPKSATTEELLPVFQPFGPIDELSILRGPDGASKGCAFLRYTNRESAVACVTALNGALKLEGAPSNIVVKFAESERDKQRAAAQKVQSSSSQMQIQQQVQTQLQQQLQLIQLASLASNPLLAQHFAYGGAAQNAWDPTGAAAAATAAAAASPAATAAALNLYNPYAAAATLASATSPPGTTPVPVPGTAANPFAGLDTFSAGLGAGYGGPGASAAAAAAGLTGIAGSNKEGPPGANLFIYHLPQEYTDVDVYNAFSAFGNILSAKVFVDKDTNQSRCFGFVSYDTPEAAQVAISQMDGCNIGGKRLKVQLKTSPGARPAGRPY